VLCSHCVWSLHKACPVRGYSLSHVLLSHVIRKPAGRKRGRPPSETGPSPAPKERKAAEAAEASEAMGDDAQGG
jgi:hypothetical protein